MPFMALTGGYYAVFFAMSVFFFPTPRLLPKYGVQISGLSVEGLTLVLVGVGLMIGSYFLADKIFIKNRPLSASRGTTHPNAAEFYCGA
jgi:hypothetical protein